MNNQLTHRDFAIRSAALCPERVFCWPRFPLARPLPFIPSAATTKTQHQSNHRGHNVAEPQPKRLTAEDAEGAEERTQRKIKILWRPWAREVYPERREGAVSTPLLP